MINRPLEKVSSFSPASVSLETARRVHTVCQQLEADWRRAFEAEAASRPQLKNYLVGASELERSALLAELLALELELRSELLDEQPTPADYIEAFPADARLIDAVFRQWQDNASTQPGTGDRQRAAESRRLPSVEGYEILDVLGRGGMGVVYTARHLRLKRLVALKMILAGSHAGDEHHARFRAAVGSQEPRRDGFCPPDTRLCPVTNSDRVRRAARIAIGTARGHRRDL